MMPVRRHGEHYCSVSDSKVFSLRLLVKRGRLSARGPWSRLAPLPTRARSARRGRRAARVRRQRSRPASSGRRAARSYRRKCAPSRATRRSRRRPESSVIGTRAARARSATTYGALRSSVCASVRPSPVMRPVGARPAPRSRPIRSATTSAPDRKVPPTSCSAKPRPPAAPAPGFAAAVTSERALGEGREARERRVDRRTLVGAHSLLRPEYRRRAA